MDEFITLKVPARQVYPHTDTRHRKSCVRQKTMDEAFLTRPLGSREESGLSLTLPSTPPDEDFDLNEPSRTKLDVDEIKKRLYERECHKLGITPVGAFMRTPTQAQIAIRHYSLGPSGARALSVPLMVDSTMTSLDLEGNAIGPEGLATMTEMLTDHCSLTHLNLKQNKLGSRGAALICQVLQRNKLIVSLNVAANDFVDRDGEMFANMLKVNKTLKSLDLSDNMLSHLSGKVLGDALNQNEILETLDLSWNQFREGGAAKLMEGVKDNISLKTLVLAFNCFSRGICERPVDPLGSTLSTNSTLKHLDVSNNRLFDLDLFMLARGLKENETLEVLKAGHNPVSVRATGGLLKAVCGNVNSGIKLLDMTDLPIAEDDLTDVDTLESREVKVIYGNVHQRETDFESGPKQIRKTAKNQRDTEQKREKGERSNGGEVQESKENTEKESDEEKTEIVDGNYGHKENLAENENVKLVHDEVRGEYTGDKNEGERKEAIDENDDNDRAILQISKLSENVIAAVEGDKDVDGVVTNDDESKGVEEESNDIEAAVLKYL